MTTTALNESTESKYPLVATWGRFEDRVQAEIQSIVSIAVRTDLVLITVLLL